MAKARSNPSKANILIRSMRSMGYSFESAIADVIDNSIYAAANNITILFPIEVYKLGSPYWREIICQAKQKQLINYKEEGILLAATKMDLPVPKFPTPAQAKKMMQIRKRLGESSIII